MNKRTNVKGLGTWLSVIGFALLLLLAPCNVRNYIQAALDIPLTEVSNKSKTTLKTASCNTSKIVEVTTTLSDQSNQLLPDFITNHLVLKIESIIAIAETTTAQIEINQSAVYIPYYILYQNLKIHLS